MYHELCLNIYCPSRITFTFSKIPPHQKQNNNKKKQHPPQYKTEKHPSSLPLTLPPQKKTNKDQPNR